MKILLVIGVCVLCILVGGVLGYRMCFRKLSFAINSKIKENETNKARYSNAYKLLQLKENGINISGFFQDNQIERVALYGYSNIGKVVERDFLNNGIKIVCAIDKKAKMIKAYSKVYTMEDDLPEFDVLLVTAVNVSVSDLKEQFERKGRNVSIILIGDVLDLLVGKIYTR